MDNAAASAAAKEDEEEEEKQDDGSGARGKVERVKKNKTMDGLFFEKELPSSLRDAAAEEGRGKKKRQIKVSTIHLMHDGFNVRCDLWNVTRNKK